VATPLEQSKEKPAMKRRTLDLFLSMGGLALAGLLLVLGLVMTSNANFAKNYVRDQLGQQHISFTTAAKLTAEEKQSACLVAYAGQALTTGKQAECYANDYIGLHTTAVAGGRTYATQGDYITGLKTRLTDAQKASPPNAATIADLNTQITAGTAARETLFKGETLRGLLLTSFGFSVFGVKGGQVATVAYLLAGLLALLVLAGFAHGLMTSKTRLVVSPERTKGKVIEPDLARA
jgi:hypothetical protein